jgi:methionyl aminopeptidase
VGDTATTVPVGIVDERTDQLLRVTEKALDCAINIAGEGVRLGDICAEIEDEAARNGFSVPNYGRRGSGPKLKSGMTLAIEPMINIGSAEVRLLDDGWTVRTADGTRSAHFEHTVLITKDGPEILTWRGKTQLK